ncbi:MAG: 23S rRNA (uracil(1939)-C(5))-methyltransferase RlmD [Eubacterium sp.]|nr:23S rRNA (uracil(1939)-C(5))-methyltransferase RlmD [Eubacterium sp.]
MLSLKKNDEIEVTIEDIGTSGEGIGRADGAVLFVRDAVPGDHILAGITKVKKTYAYARLIRIITPSPDRVDPRCDYAGPCGGCQLQTLSYEKQLEYKIRKVKDVLERIGGFSQIPMEPIIGSEEPYHYRNKAQFPIGTSKDGRIITGFYAGRSHRIIENRDCALGAPVNRQILDVVIAHMERNGIPAYDEASGKGLVRHVLIRKGFATGQILVCLILNGKTVPHEEQLADDLFAIPGMHSFSVNVNTEQTNVILGDEVRLIRGEAFITEKLQNITYRISPKSFFQVNTKQTEKLYATALEYAGLTGDETVWDLYCGAGTISLFLARQAKHVYGVEIVPEAIEDAKENAKLNGIENVTFYTGKAEEIVPAFYEAQKESDEQAVHPNVIVVDPPRKGCDASILQTMLEMAPDRIVYVSCDPATLARDLRILSDGGYQVQRVRPVDQFSQTVHVETVVLLQKK